MHKMGSTMHKCTPSKIVTGLMNNSSTAISSMDKSNQNASIKENMPATSKIAVIDIERENRLTKVISLYSKGLSQEEIAQELHVDSYSNIFEPVSPQNGQNKILFTYEHTSDLLHLSSARLFWRCIL
jgi:hypothetical protein